MHEGSYEDRRRRVRLALARLAEGRCSRSMLRVAPQELVAAGGFTRVMMSAVRGSRWVPLHLHTRDELHRESDAFLAFIEGGTDIPLVNLLVETEIVRRRASVLVDETLIHTRAFQPIVELAQSPAYVASPVLVEGRVVGVIHADRVGQQRRVDVDDRAIVDAFCAGLAVCYQRVIWDERVAERGRRVREELSRTAKALDDLEDPVFDVSVVVDVAQAPGPNGDAAPGILVDDGLLTIREREVLRRIAEGATNAVIAQRLSVSEDTIKTHVRNVLRKLRVATRGAAVARYLEVVGALDE